MRSESEFCISVAPHIAVIQIASPFRSAIMSDKVALITSCDVSVVQVGMYWLIFRGFLDNVSVSLFTFPGLFLMSKLKSASSATQRCPVELSFAVDNRYSRSGGYCQCTQ